MSAYVRKAFPAMKRKVNGYPAAYLDGPGGYQVPQRVIDAVEDYLINANANVEGAYETSRKTDRMLEEARETFADFFKCNADEVSFGANMTTLTFALSQALVREMKPGDKVLITEIDHEGNRGPWEQLRDRGMIVEEVVFDTENCVLDVEDLKRKLTRDTKVVAVNYASNGVGTITDVKSIVEMAHAVGAHTVVDAVHFAAHRPIDVQEIGTDFLLCSAYKFFGPHIGVLYAKKEVMAKLRTLRLRPQKEYPPYKIETGTLHHEGIAGSIAAVEFIADVGAKYGKGMAGTASRREKIVAGLEAFDAYEEELTQYLLDGLKGIEGIRIYGPPAGHPRTSTVSFTYAGFTPFEVADFLGEKGLFVWHGDFYATRLVERLGLMEKGGLVRVGIAPYNTKEEIDRLLGYLNDPAAIRACRGER
jgi:cysteine desulfurase family protein (TIGR01976 family)